MMVRDAIPWPETVYTSVWMSIFATIVPGSAPSRVIDEHAMPAPIEAVIAPAPWSKRKPERGAIAEADRAAHKKAGPRRIKHNARIIVRHHDASRIDRLDRYERH